MENTKEPSRRTEQNSSPPASNGAPFAEEVLLVPYSSHWPRQFENERIQLSHALAPWIRALEHVGSTSVPELAAKPILDIAMVVADISKMDEIAAPLAALSFTHYGKYGDPPRYLFVKKASAETCAVNLHIVDSNHADSWKLAAFRDQLRGDTTLREAYQALKKRFAEQYRYDRVQYTACKTDFVASVLKRPPISP